MNKKHSCVIDAENIYKALVLVFQELGTDGRHRVDRLARIGQRNVDKL